LLLGKGDEEVEVVVEKRRRKGQVGLGGLFILVVAPRVYHEKEEESWMATRRDGASFRWRSRIRASV
jgi:hypothetical protein